MSNGGNLSITGAVAAGTISATGNAASGNLSVTNNISSATLNTTGNATVGGDLIVNGTYRMSTFQI